jgi:Tfp pilus assembly protein FimV
MKTPTEYELHQLMHRAAYDPVKAHQYYEKHKKLKGRKRGRGDDSGGILTVAANRAIAGLGKGSVPKKGKSKVAIQKNARARQRKELSDQIQGMQKRLNKLEALLKKREHEEASEDRKGKAKKERAAKEADKPKTAAEKAEAARESKKNRAKHQQREKSRDKKDGKSDQKKDGDKKSGKHTVSEIKVKIKEVRGKIQAAKQKLAAL